MTTPEPAPVESFPSDRYAAIPKPAGFAVASLVLGLIGLFVSWLTLAIPSILAVIFGHVALARVRRGIADGRGLAIAGLVLGYLTLAVLALLLVAVFGLII
ncbi:MAG: DUF4190 domain-containing protein [Jiangellaceae bacterium]|nr:DUF4190 domain-containing protein [Jiangellaceae bacterium]